MILTDQTVIWKLDKLTLPVEEARTRLLSERQQLRDRQKRWWLPAGIRRGK